MEKKIVALAAEKNSKSRSRTELPANYKPGKFDVICGKGKGCFNHEGNKHFREIVAKQLDPYSEANTKLAKSAIVSSIITMVRDLSPNGGFIKRDTSTGLWHEVGDHLAREKVGQTMRDALHHQYRSSTKSKKKRRQMEQAKAHACMETISNRNSEISSKIDDLNSATLTNSDRQLQEMFTKANIEILNELNKLRDQRATKAQSGAVTNVGEAACKQSIIHPYQRICQTTTGGSIDLPSTDTKMPLLSLSQFSETIAFLRSHGLLGSSQTLANSQNDVSGNESSSFTHERMPSVDGADIMQGMNTPSFRSNDAQEENKHVVSRDLHGDFYSTFKDSQTNAEGNDGSVLLKGRQSSSSQNQYSRDSDSDNAVCSTRRGTKREREI
eukprot:CAMPEP_0178919418 /NCGR_PEP_ID=MMETSP0786-20121207/14423_1 /TAXON_ID=186022 /ORGANISM="Thalassionema frauenfeldii, Strain CCMP 1798" /LENGTH=383 /DNA_ID=CAMNT_0020593341 /DNA_START=49 /DNA_END=1200 /DNA_ORIENTATION=+